MNFYKNKNAYLLMFFLKTNASFFNYLFGYLKFDEFIKYSVSLLYFSNVQHVQ